MVFEIFLFINALIIGALIVLFVQHLAAHHRTKKPQPKPHTAEVRIPRDVRDRLIQEAEGQLQDLFSRTAHGLEEDLTESTQQMSTHLQTIFSEIIAKQQKEFNAAQASLGSVGNDVLERLKTETQSADQQLLEQLAISKAELAKKLAETAAARREELLATIDSTFSDAVMSFLLETLGHGVDLGAQTPYIMARLEENKALFKAGLSQ